MCSLNGDSDERHQIDVMDPAEHALEILSLLLSEDWNENHPPKRHVPSAHLRNYTVFYVYM